MRTLYSLSKRTEQTHWYDITSKALDRFDVIQPFGCACKLNQQFSKVMHCKKAVVGAPNVKEIDLQLVKFHPGYAWAFRREWLQSYGLFDLAVVGGGDTLLAAAVLQRNFSVASHQMKDAYASEFFKYYARVGASRLRIGMTSNVLALHLYHGTLTKIVITGHATHCQCSTT